MVVVQNVDEIDLWVFHTYPKSVRGNAKFPDAALSNGLMHRSIDFQRSQHNQTASTNKPLVLITRGDAIRWRRWWLIFSLARFGGLRRCEVTTLRWSDVMWDAGRLRIDSPKTGLRMCPLWPELLPLVRQCFDDAAVGGHRMIEGYQADGHRRDHDRPATRST